MRARRVLARAGLALLVITGGVLGTGLLGVLLLVSEPGNDWARDQIVARAPIPKGKLEIERLRFNLLDELELRGVSLRDAHGRELVGFDRLLLRYDLLGVLDRRLRVDELRLEGPRVDLQARPDGELDLLVALGLDGPSEDTGPAEPWAGLAGRVEVATAQISQGDLRYRAEGLDLHLEELGLSLGALVEGRTAKLEDLALAARLASPGDRRLTLEGDAGLVNGDLDLAGLRLALGSTRLAAEGRVGAVETRPELGLSLDLDLNPDDLHALAAMDPVLRQGLQAQLELQGPLDALEASLDLRALAGEASLKARADVLASPLTWALDLDTPGLELGELLLPVTERTRLVGAWHLEGTGTGWPELPGAQDPDLIRATVHLEGGDQVLWGEPVRDLRLDARVDAGKVAMERLSARHAVGGLVAEGDVDVPAGKADLQTRVSLPDLGALARYGLEDLGGAARYQGRVRADWSGEVAEVDVSGTLEASGLRGPEGVAAQELSVPLEASVVGGSVEAQGSLSLRGLSHPQAGLESLGAGWTVSRSEDGALRVEVQQLAASALRSADGSFGLGGLSGHLSGGLDARGEPWGDWELALDALNVPGGQTGAGPLRGSLEGGALELTADIQGAEGPLLATDLRGDLEGGAWEIRSLVVTPTPGTPLEATEAITFRLVDGGADEVHAALSSPSGALGVDGRLVPADLDARLSLEGLDLAWVARLAALADPSDPLAGVQGVVNLQGQITSKDQGAPALDLELVVTGARQEGTTEAPVDLALTASLAEDLLTLDGGVSLGERRLLALGGELPVEIRVSEGTARLRCGVEATLRALVGPLPSTELGRVIPEATGTFDQLAADLRVLGDVCDPELRVISAARVKDESLGVVQASLDLGRAGSDLRVRGGVDADLARRVRVEGSTRTRLSDVLGWALQEGPEPDLSAPSTWVTDLELNVIPLGVPLSMLGAPEEVGGSLAGGLQVSGGIDDLDVAGGLQWVGGRLGAVPLQLGFFGLVPAEDGYELSVMLGFEAGGAISVDGFVPMRIDLAGDLVAGIEAALEDPRLKLTISDGQGGHARIPLSTLGSERGGISDTSGDLELWGTVEGSVASPLPDVQIRVDSGALTLDDLAVRYEQIGLDAELRADRLRLRELSIQSRPRVGARQGSLRASGEVGLVGFAPSEVALDATLDDFLVSDSTATQLTSSGEVHARGPWPDLALSGALRLGNTRIIKRKDELLANTSLALSPDIAIYREGQLVRATGLGQRPALYERFALDLDLDLNRNLRLKVEVPTESGYGEQLATLSSLTLDATLGGELDVGGTVGQPTLGGLIEDISGTVDVLGATFTLEPESTIRFGGAYDDPILGLRATRSTEEYGDVHVDITQNVSDVSVAFSADDYPDPSDALSLVLLGKPASELSSGEGASMLLAAARSGIAGQLEQAVGLSAVDQFEIDPSSGAVTIGKALSESLFLTLERRFAVEDPAENLTQASLEWMILRQLYAEFVTGDAGSSSADIYWKWKF